MLSEEEKEKFIQEMTEVRSEKLNKEVLKLYNTIMQILDRNKQLETENKELKADKQRIIELNNKYLQKLVYLLSPTTHALGDDYNSKFKQIIKENIDLETCKIKQKLKECWGIDKF